MSDHEHEANKLYDHLSEYCAARAPEPVLQALGELVADTLVACSPDCPSAIATAASMFEQIGVRIQVADETVGIPFRGGELQ